MYLRKVRFFRFPGILVLVPGSRTNLVWYSSCRVTSTNRECHLTITPSLFFMPWCEDRLTLRIHRRRRQSNSVILLIPPIASTPISHPNPDRGFSSQLSRPGPYFFLIVLRRCMFDGPIRGFPCEFTHYNSTFQCPSTFFLLTSSRQSETRYRRRRGRIPRANHIMSEKGGSLICHVQTRTRRPTLGRTSSPCSWSVCDVPSHR